MPKTKHSKQASPTGLRTSVVLAPALRTAAEQRAAKDAVTLSALIHAAMEAYLGVQVPRLERGKYDRGAK